MPRRRRLILVGCFLIVLAVIVVLPLGRGILAGAARRMAARRYEAGAASRAEAWLAWSDWLDPGNGRTDLMRAACFRYLNQLGRWAETIQSAERNGAPAEQVSQERRLVQILAGASGDGVEREWNGLIEAGVSPHEVAATFIHHYLRLEEPEKAKVALDAWSANYPGDARVAYMAGIYWRWQSKPERAETEFKRALASRPDHELARRSLAEMFEEQHRLGEALEQYGELAARSDDPVFARLNAARLLRKLGHPDAAQAELEALTSRPDLSSWIAVQRGQIELERGSYQTARRLFEQAGPDRIDDREVLVGTAIAFGLDGQTIRAGQLLDQLDAQSSRSLRTYDLKSRLAVERNDERAAAELKRISLPSTTEGAIGAPPAAKEPREGAARELYLLHCAACHGASGDGNGRAARHLFPRPRDLRAERTRLVSTRNSVPTLDDLQAGLQRGLPGTAMPAFDNLSPDQRKLLAEEILRLRRDGLREQLVNELRNEGEEIEEEEVRRAVQLCTTPGEVARVPRFDAPDSQAILRGQATYLELGCDNCHGKDGSGAGDTLLFDEKGRPSPPRDLVHEPFKGGDSPESIYLRIFLGMPGTPHPACSNVAQAKLIDLVHYCRSLSQEPKRMLTNHQRAIRASGRPYLAESGGPAIP